MACLFLRLSSRALDLNPMLPESLSMLGAIRAADFDWKEAERKFRLALELDPNSDETRPHADAWPEIKMVSGWKFTNFHAQAGVTSAQIEICEILA
jgi:hypothetical protein